MEQYFEPFNRFLPIFIKNSIIYKKALEIRGLLFFQQSLS